jgi:8-amino-7-oxononanoate synthase
VSPANAVLGDVLATRATKGLTRSRHVVQSAQSVRLVVDGRAMLHFGSNDYLGLAGDPEIIAAACDGAVRYGVGAGASHLISGHSSAHDLLERALAAWIAPVADAEAILFSTGYMANLGIITALVGRGDAVFADKLNHASLNDAAILSRADLVRYAHCDVEALERRLASSVARRKVIATDAVFSMDGDIAPLPALLELAKRHDAWLLVDDAHGFGVTGEGRGTLAHFGLQSDRLIYMGTLGKAAGVAGAFACAADVVVETLLQTARSYMFSTASPPMLAHALAQSLTIIRDDTDRRRRLAARVAQWRVAAAELPWRCMPSETAIQPLIVGTNAQAVRLSDALWDRGIWVPAVRPPTVPQGSARLRITFSAAHEEAEVDRLVAALRDIGL